MYSDTIHVYIYIYIYNYTCVYIYISIYICIYTYIHVNTHMQIYMQETHTLHGPTAWGDRRVNEATNNTSKHYSTERPNRKRTSEQARRSGFSTCASFTKQASNDWKSTRTTQTVDNNNPQNSLNCFVNWAMCVYSYIYIYVYAYVYVCRCTNVYT